ncbi:hypothetical protein M0657_011474 [Pyricularia oryzae]|uniref:Uncharacterized protein n=1 Tax=Pyricularia oryzae TaxID=318829 RepID=A0A4V1C4Q4_PYROR|nr:hypothetical protein M9X92_011440 [Pyricularia oryzae]KAI7910207.1 hypothetical protein M0657_011474 [Pyricularia oryzae]QBZ53695.1 hypothetical protein PoMZ_09384 [Pyricularia oryzae]
MRFSHFDAVLLLATPVAAESMWGLCSPRTGMCTIWEGRFHKQDWHCDTPCLPPFICGMTGRSITVHCGPIPKIRKNS